MNRRVLQGPEHNASAASFQGAKFNNPLPLLPKILIFVLESKMSSNQMTAQIYAMIAHNGGNAQWLERIYGLMTELQKTMDVQQEWETLTPEQASRLEESRKQHRDGKVVSHQEVLERSSKWHSK